MVEKLKARGTKTDNSDEAFELKGEQKLVHDVFASYLIALQLASLS